MKARVSLFLKGMAMGAADIVPGVSGGTIAFISGIYEELLETITLFNVTAFKLLLKGRFAAFWKAVNGPFIVTLLGGILTSIVLFVRVIQYLLENYPVELWSFFFGLIIASAVLIARQIRQWSILPVVALIAGIVIAYFITSSTPEVTEGASLWYILLCGMLAICAMVLPGISGSFILLLLGAYQLVLGTIRSFIDGILALDFDQIWEHGKTVIVFVIGAGAGLLIFTRLLNFLFKHYHDIVVASLIGFLIGSLNKVWPWKEVVDQIDDKHVIEQNVSPFNYESLTGEPAVLGIAIALALFGFVFVYGVEKYAMSQKPHSSPTQIGSNPADDVEVYEEK